jgi:hypothetical protein
MKEISMRSLTNRILAIAGLGLFGMCAVAGSTPAQNRVNGSFTLSHEVRWQSARLPAGNYTFSLASTDRMTPMIVTGPNGSVFELAVVISQRHSDKPSALILERRAGTSFVREMYLDNAGLQFDYSVPKIREKDKLLAQGPVSTEQILISTGK